jgi:hypothetical protein
LRALTDAADAEVWLAELERAERFFAEAPSLMRYAPWVDEVARAQALAGRLDAFQATVARRLSERDRNSFVRQTFDPTDLLPPAGRLADAAAYVAAIEAALSVGAALRDEDFTASLALLGHWCIEAGLTQQARALLEKSIAAAGEPGAHWLFPIDLADALGEEDRATQMAVQLAEQDLLPVVRLVPLLEKLAATDALAAATLARRAATYSNHPEILRHAKTEP